ncbi:MAG: IPTL-CTERM sorting domain-containing protein [Bacteroidetes bacterium]|nr:IPTL-CTERM sorting domain-containing protein [Bacteroidota bacterium]
MKKQLLSSITAVILFLMPTVNFGQAPNLGAASGFAYFTSAGAFNVTGASTIVTGDVGNYVGAFSGFPPGILLGAKHLGDPLTFQASSDLAGAWGQLSALTCGLVLGTPMTSQILTPNVYCILSAGVLNGDVTLDGQNNPGSIFIFKIGGAFATDYNSHIFLINQASACNVYWQIDGDFALHGVSVFRGTVIASGAIHLTETAALYGRGLSTAGAIDLTNNTVTLCSTLPNPPGTIPTMSEWGLIIFGVLLLGVGTVYILRRRQTSYNL